MEQGAAHLRRMLAAHHRTHLQDLEAESIHILREVAAEFERPVMLYSIGKDSSVMVRLAQKAFAPAPLPFPLLLIHTTWEFREMLAFCDRFEATNNVHVIRARNEDALAAGINPFDHGSSVYTQEMTVAGVVKALKAGGYDVALGGARRDEERSRAKERVFSFRDRYQQWDPKNQRPELWDLYNGRTQQGESVRAFPISNWTELDVWQYIMLEDIPIVPLYFAAPRPVVERHGALILVDDSRLKLAPGETPTVRSVRFRTLGCYPVTAAMESTATTVPEIVAEMMESRYSERQGRLIDADAEGSMEKKKREGYF